VLQPTYTLANAESRFLPFQGMAIHGGGSGVLRPVQMFVQEPEGFLTVDRVAPIEELYLCLIGEVELSIEPSHFRVLVRNPLISSDAIVVSAFHHERPRDHQVSHFRVVECAAHIEIWHLPLDAVHEAEVLVGARNFFVPGIKIAGTDREAVSFENGRNANRRLTPIAQAVKSDPAGIYHR
jgi:hypothetical protein